MTTEQKIERCKNINWYTLTDDQLDHILEITGTPLEGVTECCQVSEEFPVRVSGATSTIWRNFPVSNDTDKITGG